MLKLTTRETERVLGYIKHRWFPNISDNLEYHQEHTSGREICYLGDKGFDVKVFCMTCCEGFGMYDYNNGVDSKRAYEHLMNVTSVTVRAKVEDKYVQVFWQDKWRWLIEYNPKRRIPAQKTQDRVLEIFRMNSGLPKWAEITLDWEV